MRAGVGVGGGGPGVEQGGVVEGFDQGVGKGLGGVGGDEAASDALGWIEVARVTVPGAGWP